jgi:HEAT repeat protein
MHAAQLEKILKDPNSTEFQKAKACQRVAELGVRESVPILASLLADEHLSTYARYGLEPIPGPTVDDALRSALPKVKGVLLIGVINSIGFRRDSKAGPALAKLLYDDDTEIARAAAAALGKISGVPAMKDLVAALGKTKSVVRMAVADAGLVCAERLIAQGRREDAMALYTTLSAPDIPKPVRLAAMHGIIREETSTSRPR